MPAANYGLGMLLKTQEIEAKNTLNDEVGFGGGHV